MNQARWGLRGAMALIGLPLLYLLTWPVPVEPVAWNAPADAGLVGPFAPNERLSGTELIELGPHEGPEDIARGPDGLLYTGTRDGVLLRLRPDGSRPAVFARTGGRPLGLEFDADGSLIVANAYLGLQRVSPGGDVEILTDSFAGKRIRYSNDVAIARDGMIFFSDASSRFGAEEFGGTYDASRLDIMEHGGHGRILRFDPATGDTSLVLDGLNFANGISISADQRLLMVSETGAYRILRHWLAGPAAGTTEVLIDNLPGFPDNINNGLDGRFWVGLVAPRNRLLDRMSDRPWLRRMVQRLPAALRPKAEPSSRVFAIGADGEVSMSLQDSTARLPNLTGAYETAEALWLTSLFGTRIARLEKRDGTYPPRRPMGGS